MAGARLGGTLTGPEGLPISAEGAPTEVGWDHSFFSAPQRPHLLRSGGWGVGVPAQDRGAELNTSQQLNILHLWASSHNYITHVDEVAILEDWKSPTCYILSLGIPGRRVCSW